MYSLQNVNQVRLVIYGMCKSLEGGGGRSSGVSFCGTKKKKCLFNQSVLGKKQKLSRRGTWFLPEIPGNDFFQSSSLAKRLQICRETLGSRNFRVEKT